MMRRSPVACLCHVSPPRSSASAAILLWFPLDAACTRLPLFVLLLHGIVLDSGRPAAHCLPSLSATSSHCSTLSSLTALWNLGCCRRRRSRRLATNRCANFYSALWLAESLSQPRALLLYPTKESVSYLELYNTYT